ncbi:hypothetical protein [Bifidobacterium oedipodis]|uniref:Uncharacterized protein n=1 Tax=Bifidobacterium oedipodis TaxID=2675322 RepID=A0A7Y0EPA1_9BIFI|nr:hypothetical protein [Bifidobacterium sp. DSM 109957]NMM93927.1 hypothetical protein [Bifidobacterium sp. DSM 109957]
MNTLIIIVLTIAAVGGLVIIAGLCALIADNDDLGMRLYCVGGAIIMLSIVVMIGGICVGFLAGELPEVESC